MDVSTARSDTPPPDYYGVDHDDKEKQPLLVNLPPNNESQFSFLSPLKKVWSYDCLPCVPARYALAIMGFLGFVNVYALRINLSMAIIAMVNGSANHSSHHHEVFDWSSKEQGYILSSFFYGYILTQLPGGYIASRFGGRYVYGIGIVMTAILTLLTPLAAHIHIGALIGLRALEGFFEGVTFPAMHALWGKWAPPKERSILATITYSGPFVGNIISFPLSAVLCEYTGWPSVFYVFGALGTTWFIAWLFLGFDSPSTHPRISAAEKKYIETSIEEDSVLNSTNDKTPWFRIMTSPAVWAIIIAHVCNNWGNYTLLTCIPSYFKDALNLQNSKSLIQNGIFSAIPYVAFTAAALASGPLADLMRKNCFSTAFVRKLFTATAFILSAGGLLCVGYLGSDKTNSVTLLTVSVGFGGLAMAGFNSNHIDIAPQYAGILMGITNLAATIPGIIGPIVAKTIAKKPSPGQNQTSVYRDEWREVFMIAAEIYVFGAIVYVILADGKRQWWAGGDRNNPDRRGIISSSSGSIYDSADSMKHTIQKKGKP